ncbi:hypothetical protein [Bartonella gliris]|uniref:hypothetical protein n=1 Tax=Bartonella gliris TaxID=3004109 RepID=UPI00295EB3D1|nr:hypothetical protein [Bartonella gliris]
MGNSSSSRDSQILCSPSGYWEEIKSAGQLGAALGGAVGTVGGGAMGAFAGASAAVATGGTAHTVDRHDYYTGDSNRWCERLFQWRFIGRSYRSRASCLSLYEIFSNIFLKLY